MQLLHTKMVYTTWPGVRIDRDLDVKKVLMPSVC